jgi:hypothetical protein
VTSYVILPVYVLAQDTLDGDVGAWFREAHLRGGSDKEAVGMWTCGYCFSSLNMNLARSVG